MIQRTDSEKVYKFSKSGRLDLLIKALESKSKKEINDLIHNINPSHGRSPVVAAIAKGNLNIIKHLVDECGVDLEPSFEHSEKYNYRHWFGNPPMIWLAAFFGELDLVKFLLTRSDKDDIDSFNWKSEVKTPLHAAISQGRDDVIRYLVEHGADLKDCLLHVNNDKEVDYRRLYRLLLDFGVDINARSKNDGHTVLHDFARNSHYTLNHKKGNDRRFQFLISDCGAQLDVPDFEGETPLMALAVASRRTAFDEFWRENNNLWSVEDHIKCLEYRGACLLEPVSDKNGCPHCPKDTDQSFNTRISKRFRRAKAIKCLREALKLRQQHNLPLVHSDIPEKIGSLEIKAVASLDELEKFSKIRDEFEIRSQVMLIKLRTFEKSYSYSILYGYGNYYLSNGSFMNGFSLNLYALRQIQLNLPPIHELFLDIFASCFSRLSYAEDNNKDTPATVTIVIHLMDILAREVQRGTPSDYQQTFVSEESPPRGYQEDFKEVFKRSLDSISKCWNQLKGKANNEQKNAFQRSLNEWFEADENYEWELNLREKWRELEKSLWV